MASMAIGSRFRQPRLRVVNIQRRGKAISSWEIKGPALAVEINCRRVRFPRLLGRCVPRKFQPDPSERLWRQRDYDGERQLRAFHGRRDAQRRTPLLCRRRLFLRPCLQVSLSAGAPRIMARAREWSAPAADGVVYRHVADGPQAQEETLSQIRVIARTFPIDGLFS